MSDTPTSTDTDGTPIERLLERHKREIALLQESCDHTNLSKLSDIIYMHGADGPDHEQSCLDCGKVVLSLTQCQVCCKTVEDAIFFHGNESDENFLKLSSEAQEKIRGRWGDASHYLAEHFCRECWEAGRLSSDYLNQLEAAQAICGGSDGSGHELGEPGEIEVDCRQEPEFLSNRQHTSRACKKCRKLLEVNITCGKWLEGRRHCGLPIVTLNLITDPNPDEDKIPDFCEVCSQFDK